MKKKEKKLSLYYLPVVLGGDVVVFLSFDVSGGLVVVNIRALSFTDKPENIFRSIFIEYPTFRKKVLTSVLFIIIRCC